MRTIVLLASALALASCFGSCSRAREVAVSELPTFLRPLDGAFNSHAQGNGSVTGVRYQLKAAYPAEAALSDIRQRIPSDWIPRTEDSMNPGIRTSEVRGWTLYYDDTKRPSCWVHRWSSEWQNASGDILSYDLQYYSVASFAFKGPEAPSNDQLTVVAGVTPHAAWSKPLVWLLHLATRKH